jgi:diguanylate cyclase (GGDEF)-like protein
VKTPVSSIEQREESDPLLNRKAYSLHDWGLPTVVGVLLLALWALLLVVATVQKGRLIQGSQDELSNLRGAVAQHTVGLFRDVDTALRVIDRWLAANQRIDPRTDPHFVALTDELRRPYNGLIDLSLITADGMLYHIPSPDGRPAADVSGRSYFTAQPAKGDRVLHIGAPIQNLSTKKWVIPITWRLERPVSGMAMALASIDITMLSDIHDGMRLKPNGAIAFMRGDGVILSRAPYNQYLIGINVANSVRFKDEFGVKESGFFVSDNAVTDGIPRLISYQRLPGYPVTVLVNRGLEDILAVFEYRRNILFALSAALTLLALAFTWTLHRSQRALHQAQQELQRIEATDSLTGVMSRRAFLENAQREFSRARRYQRPAAVLVLDLDHFKEVNDRHGHGAGDNVLRECAAAWLAALRDQDVLGRLGGEEFCGILPETSLEAGMQVAERLRKAVSDLEFKGSSGTFSVTVSIGLAMVSPGDTDLMQVIECADRALYLAKERGRDRVASEEAMNPPMSEAVKS